MTLIAGGITLSKGPTLLLPRQAAAARISTPDWPVLRETSGRRQLVDTVANALTLEADHPLRVAAPAMADQAAPLFLAELFAELAIVLQQITGHPVTRLRALRQGDPSQPLAVWEYMLPRTAQASGLAAERLIVALAGAKGVEIGQLPFDDLHAIVTGVNTAVGNSVVEVLLAGAQRREVPWHTIDPVWPMFGFGQGSKTKRLMSTICEQQGHISTLFSQDKLLSLHVLREAGFPVPSHRLVGSEEAAVAAAELLGYPVVVKPTDQLRSRGVSINLRSSDSVRAAFRKAATISRSILVETQLPGLPYRILVIGGKACAAMKRSAPSVVGDGEATIGELIEKANEARARTAIRTAHGPRRINVENFKEELAPCLAEQGLALESVPEAGRSVQLAFKGETGRGGENVDVTDMVHPDNLLMAEQVAEVLEIKVMGLDFMTEDIARSFKKVPCGINEVNSEPALSLHMSATSKPRDVVNPFLDYALGAGNDRRIPVFCCLGETAEEVLRFLEAALRTLGQKTGLATAGGSARVGRFLLPATNATQRPAVRVIQDARVDCALVALTPEDFAVGLAFDRCTACYLAQAPAGSDEKTERFIEQARLMAHEIADTLLLPAADYEAWNSHINFGGRRVVLVSDTAGLPTAIPQDEQANRVEVLELSTATGLDVLYHHGGHCDRLVSLNAVGKGQEKGELPGQRSLLIALAALVALGWQAQDIRRVLAAAQCTNSPLVPVGVERV